MARKYWTREMIEENCVPVPMSGCLLWCGGTMRRGYGVLMSNGKSCSVHRFMWSIVNGPIPQGMHVLHKCDIPACVNPNHLFLGTHTDNMRDMHKKHRWANKLTSDDVQSIRNCGDTQTAVAEKYGISQSLVSRIRGGLRWRINHAA